MGTKASGADARGRRRVCSACGKDIGDAYDSSRVCPFCGHYESESFPYAESGDEEQSERVEGE